MLDRAGRPLRACFTLFGIILLLLSLASYVLFVDAAPAFPRLPELPGDLRWFTEYKGCKEATRGAWRDPNKVGRTCTVYVLDVGELAAREGVPQCSVDNFATDPHRSLILPNTAVLPYDVPKPSRHEESDMYPWSSSPHYMAQSSGPWFLVQSLLNNTNSVVRNINKADVVFVYDYCYIIWSLAEVHARYHWWLRQKGYQPNTDVLQYVLQLYRGISQLPRYQADAGASFVFWQPHTSVFGDASMWGEALVPKFTVTFSCQVFQNSLFLVPCMYLRWRCDRYSPERTLVVPQASMDILENRYVERDIFLQYKANCLQPSNFYSIGKQLRIEMVLALQTHDAPDMYVHCTEGTIGSTRYNEQTHEELMAMLFRSVFCPVAPGDDQSTQHLTERYIAGCIPVFVGPPLHGMPLDREVNYPKSAIFINITNSSSWMQGTVMEERLPLIPMEGDLEVLHYASWQRDAESVKWWIAFGIQDSDFVELENLVDIVPFLRSIPEEQVREMQAMVQQDRAKFMYVWSMDGRPGANKIILDNMCHFVGKYCSRKMSVSH